MSEPKPTNKPKLRHQSEYIQDVIKALGDGKINAQKGEMIMLNVYHDTWCTIWWGGACNCLPDVIQGVRIQ